MDAILRSLVARAIYINLDSLKNKMGELFIMMLGKRHTLELYSYKMMWSCTTEWIQ
jgi:hypothetical protein